MDFEGLTVKKNVFTQQTAEIRWILLNYVDGTIRPININIKKPYTTGSTFDEFVFSLFTRDVIARILGPFLFFKRAMF